MKYLLMIHGNERKNAEMLAADPNGMKMVMDAHNAFGKKHEKQLRGGEALHPTTEARTLRNHNGKVVVTNGPFAETTEQLGGYYVIEAANVNEAVDVARDCPGLDHGATFEVRPIMEF